MISKAQKAFHTRLKRGWTEQDRSRDGWWFSPSTQRLWQEWPMRRPDAEIIADCPDAVQVMKSGCPKCLVGYADIMADPMFACDLCHDTGFPVFSPAE